MHLIGHAKSSKKPACGPHGPVNSAAKVASCAGKIKRRKQLNALVESSAKTSASVSLGPIYARRRKSPVKAARDDIHRRLRHLDWRRARLGVSRMIGTNAILERRDLTNAD
jgi:hypothetical protein